jgi:hypothetical protein
VPQTSEFFDSLSASNFEIEPISPSWLLHTGK